MKYYDLNKINTTSDEFKKWNDKAQKLLDELSKLSSSEKKKFLYNHDHWKDIKEIFINTFGKLCWYSDCDLAGAFGHIDHFRPKKRSKNLNKDIMLPDGYWFLAYDYTNYRLSCEKVNIGKSDYFPIKNSSQAGDILKEDIILLDPCKESDTQLVGYREGGEIVTQSSNDWEEERVKISTKIYKWNEFVNDREQVISRCENVFNLYILVHSQDYKEEVVSGIIQSLKNELKRKRAFSSVAYNYLMFKSNLPEYEEIRNDFQTLIQKLYTVES